MPRLIPWLCLSLVTLAAPLSAADLEIQAQAQPSGPCQPLFVRLVGKFEKPPKLQWRVAGPNGDRAWGIALPKESIRKTESGWEVAACVELFMDAESLDFAFREPGAYRVRAVDSALQLESQELNVRVPAVTGKLEQARKLFAEQLAPLAEGQVRDWHALCVVLVGGRKNTGTPAGRLWSLLDEDLQKLVVKGTAEPLLLAQRKSLVEAFDAICREKDIYDAQAFKSVKLTPAATELVARDFQPLTPVEKYQRNRGLLEAAFKDQLVPAVPGGRQLAAFYADKSSEDALAPLREVAAKYPETPYAALAAYLLLKADVQRIRAQELKQEADLKRQYDELRAASDSYRPLTQLLPKPSHWHAASLWEHAVCQGLAQNFAASKQAAQEFNKLYDARFEPQFHAQFQGLLQELETAAP
jgi:hypothetical protein